MGIEAHRSGSRARRRQYSDEWHVTHLTDPRSIVPQSVMPGYGFLGQTDLDYHDIAGHLKVNRAIGVPYSDDQIAHAAADLRAQSDPDDKGVDDFQKRYPKAAARDFGGKPGRITEMDALVAYLQMLGTLVDFKLYDDKADLR
jgi:cytochrome c oxidase cbb3-type subunit II